MFRKLFGTTALLLLLAICASASPAPKQADRATPETARLPEGQVVLDGTPIFKVRERVLSFTPSDRAKLISDRIATLARNSLLNFEALAVLQREASADIVYEDMVIMTVTDTDAETEGKSRKDLADSHVREIRSALETYRREHGRISILTGAAYTSLATASLAVLLFLINRLLPRVIAKIESLRDIRIRSVRFQSLELIDAGRIISLIIASARAARIILILLLFYVYIPLVFSFFPWTKGYTSTLLHFITTPFITIGNAVWEFLPNLFFIAVIALVTRYGLAFVRLFFAEIEKGAITLAGFFPEWAEPTFRIVRFLVIAFAAVVAFPYLPGSESPAFKGVSIFLGVLFSLGSTSVVANIVAGMVLTYMRAFRIGDRIKVGDTVGDVLEKTPLVTRISTIKNEEITIPNSVILGSHIINYSSSAHDYGLILHTRVTIGYDVPWRTVHELLISAASATAHIMELPAPYVLQISLDDFYVTYELNAYTDKPSKMAAIYSEMLQNIQDKFNESGVEIMSPHYSQIRDGNSTTTPQAYRPEGYTPPAIRIYSTGDRSGSDVNPCKKNRDEQ